MTLDEVYEYYGSANKAAKSIGVVRQTFYGWITRGYIPLVQQKKFEAITKGKLKASSKVIIEDVKPTTNDYPRFRYFSKEHGICEVRSIVYRRKKTPRIVCFPLKNSNKSFSAFDIENLMQSANVFDVNGIELYERDIVLIDKQKIELKSIIQDSDLLLSLKKLKKNFKIIGNSFNKKEG